MSPLAELQVLPANEIPITSWNNHDEAFLNVAQGIRSVVHEMHESHLNFVKVNLKEEKEQNSTISARVHFLRGKIDGYNRRQRELSDEIVVARQQLSLYQEISDKLEEQKASLDSVQADLQKQLEITEIDQYTSLTIFGLREDVKNIHGKFSSEIDTMQQRLRSYQETCEAFEREQADLKLIQAWLQRELERASLITSISSGELIKLQEQERKTSEILTKTKL